MQASLWRFACCLLVLGGSAASGQEKESEAPAPKLTISRADLARAYLRFDAAVTAFPPPAEKVAEINQRFDAATTAFFGGSLAKVAEGVSGLTAELLPEVTSKPRQALADALKVKMYGLGIARIQPIYQPAAAPAEPQTFELQISQGKTVWLRKPFEISATAKDPVELYLVNEKGKPIEGVGTFNIAIVGEGIAAIEHPPVYAVSGPRGDVFEQARRDREALEKFEVGEELAQSLAACKARQALITPTPSEANSAEFLANPFELSEEVRAEWEELKAGKNPYRGKIGDYWRIFTEGQSKVPFRVYAPQSIQGKESVPLVIALHGAGGDENMFMDAYGQGEIKRLADQHGFVVASPATFFFAVHGKYFDRLLEVMTDCYPIDPSRVYVLGHSMGGGATSFLARERAEKIAAAACLAGGRGFPTKEKLAPTLVIAAELDGVIPLEALKKGVEPAIAAGMPIEFRVLPDYGHTIMVGHQLPTAVKWLLGHQRTPPGDGKDE